MHDYVGFFQAWISMVNVRVRGPCDLGYESWSQKLESQGYAENRIILGSLVLTH